jgi:hypothetical protein
MPDLLHAAWIILGVVLFVEFVRQSWRANRCQAQAEQRDAERDAASPDRKTSRSGFEALHHLKRQEDVAQLWAWSFRILAAILATAWAYLTWN